MMNVVKRFCSYRLELTVITPVHIGSGDMGLNINSLADGNYIYVFNYDKLLKNSPKLLRTLRGKKDIELTEYRKEIIAENGHEYKIKNYIVPSKGSKYKASKPQDEDKPSLIDFVIRDGNGIPYIPGSSLKGCIVSAFFQQNSIGLHKQNFSIENDNYLSVGDGILQSDTDCTMIYQVLNRSRYGKDDSRFTRKLTLNPCEMLKPETKFISELRIQQGSPAEKLLISNLKGHYMEHERYTNMKNKDYPGYINKEKLLMQVLATKEGQFDVIIPLGKYKGREFNLDDDHYDILNKETEKIRNEIDQHKLQVKEIQKAVNERGLALDRRVVAPRKTLPLGWVGVKVMEKKEG